MTQTQPPVSPPSVHRLAPHRGTAILVLGILSLVISCGGIGWILGIIAWVMGNSDLREMDAGRMDPSGRGIAQAGKVCGMVSVIMALVGVAIWVLLVVLGVAGAVLGGGLPNQP
jgi:hypothetical protein